MNEVKMRISKLYDVIHSVFMRKSRREAVLIPSKMGLPSVRACAVVLADAGTGCPTQGIAAVPPISVNDPGVSTSTKGEYDNTLFRSESIIFKSIAQELKSHVLNMDGLIDINFGKAILDRDELEATKVKFDPDKLSFRELIKAYALRCSDCAVLCHEERIDQMNSEVAESGVKMPVIQISYFYY